MDFYEIFFQLTFSTFSWSLWDGMCSAALGRKMLTPCCRLVVAAAPIVAVAVAAADVAASDADAAVAVRT